ncbi:hypothetical protein F5Y18DRAFT_385926, partial [Xylariaceae sp. FL1019]
MAITVGLKEVSIVTAITSLKEVFSNSIEVITEMVKVLLSAAGVAGLITVITEGVITEKKVVVFKVVPSIVVKALSYNSLRDVIDVSAVSSVGSSLLVVTLLVVPLKVVLKGIVV